MKTGTLEMKRYSGVLPILLLIIISFLIYGQTISFDFVWDDNGPHLVQNTYLQELSRKSFSHLWTHPHQGMFIPVSYSAIFIITCLSKLLTGIAFNPSIFHLVNVFIHSINCILVFLFLKRILKQDAASFIGAFIFLVHPIQTEAVALVTEFRGLFSALWGLLFLLYSERYVLKGKRSINGILFCVLLFCLSVFSKPSGVVFFPIMTIFALMFGHSTAKQVASFSIPYLFISIFIVFLSKMTQPAFVLKYPVPFFSRFFIWMDSLIFYMVKIVFPVSFSPSYARTPHLVLSSWLTYVLWIIPLALIILLIVYHKKFRNISFAFFIFVVGLLPVSGLVPFIFQNWSTVADRYIYIPMLGVALLMGTLYQKFCFRYFRVFVLILIGMLALDTSLFQVPVWKNNLTLWSHCIEQTPTEANAYYNRGNEYMRKKLYERAGSDFEHAISLDPGFTKALYKKGYLALGQKQFHEALEYFNTILEIDPEFAIAYVSNAVAYYYLKDYEKAWAEVRKAQMRGIQVNQHFLQTLTTASHKN